MYGAGPSKCHLTPLWPLGPTKLSVQSLTTVSKSEWRATYIIKLYDLSRVTKKRLHSQHEESFERDARYWEVESKLKFYSSPSSNF